MIYFIDKVTTAHSLWKTVQGHSARITECLMPIMFPKLYIYIHAPAYIHIYIHAPACVHDFRNVK